MIQIVTYTREPHNVQRARQFVADHLVGLPHDLADRAVLMASELVTNSLRHASGPIILTLELTDDAVRISVGDDGPSTPVVRDPTPEEESGRGLRIVGALADEWGLSSDRHSRNTVWFCLSLPPAPTDVPVRHHADTSGGR